MLWIAAAIAPTALVFGPLSARSLGRPAWHGVLWGLLGPPGVRFMAWASRPPTG